MHIATHSPRHLSFIEEFTCVLRLFMLQSKCGREDRILNISGNSDLWALLPCTDTLLEHLNYVNYQAGIWKWEQIAKSDMLQELSGCG